MLENDSPILPASYTMDIDINWTEKLIAAIQKRPIIFDRTLPEYSNRDEKKNAWTEVCKTVVENWDSLSLAERLIKGNDVQQRWRNLRCCFRRELRDQRRKVSGQGSHKKRKYLYFDQLTFLLPQLEDKSTASDLENEYVITEARVTKEEPLSTYESPSPRAPTPPSFTLPAPTPPGFTPPDPTPPGPTLPIPTASQSAKRKVTYEESLLTILKNKQEEVDEDKSFLLSLLPGLKRLKSETKCEAKIEFLRMLNRFEMNDKHNRTPTIVSRGSQQGYRFEQLSQQSLNPRTSTPFVSDSYSQRDIELPKSLQASEDSEILQL